MRRRLTAAVFPRRRQLLLAALAGVSAALPAAAQQCRGTPRDHEREGLALLATAINLDRCAPSEVSGAFIASRFATGGRQTYGIGIDATAARAIIARASPLT